MPAAYEIRAGGDAKNKKQSMADLKLRRLNELNVRLREDLDRPRIRVSEAGVRYDPLSALYLRAAHLVAIEPLANVMAAWSRTATRRRTSWSRRYGGR